MGGNTRKQIEIVSSSSSSCGNKKEQLKSRKRIKSRENVLCQATLEWCLRARALPLIEREKVSWLSPALWEDVCDYYNTEAREAGLMQYSWVDLVNLAKTLDFCRCGLEDKCDCLIPDFPDTQEHGEVISQLSVSGVSSPPDNELTVYKEVILAELTRLQDLNMFKDLDRSIKAQESWIYELEMSHGIMIGDLFLKLDDEKKAEMTMELIRY